MKLSTTELLYMGSGGYVEFKEVNSCDVLFANSGSRPKWNREGTYINKAIDSLEINFKRGYNSIIDALGLNDEIQLKWGNGAFYYSGTFVVNNKINKKTNNEIITYISVMPKLGVDITVSARGGTAGHVDNVLQNGLETVTAGVSYIDAYKRTDSDAKYVAKTDTLKVKKDSTGYYVEEW